MNLVSEKPKRPRHQISLRVRLAMVLPFVLAAIYILATESRWEPRVFLPVLAFLYCLLMAYQGWASGRNEHSLRNLRWWWNWVRGRGTENELPTLQLPSEISPRRPEERPAESEVSDKPRTLSHQEIYLLVLIAIGVIGMIAVVLKKRTQAKKPDLPIPSATAPNSPQD